jgi:Papain family cysteine protease
MEVYDNLDDYRPGETYAAIAGNLRGGHAVVVVGYDDSRGGIGAFRILNSWADNWGEEGYFWMSYTLFRQIVREAYMAQDIVAEHPFLAAGDASVLDGFRFFDNSGYSFAQAERVPWNSPEADILVAKQNVSELRFASLFLPFDAPPYNSEQDDSAQSGILKLAGSDYDDVQNCPSSGYQYHWTNPEVGDVYCVRTRSGTGFVKIRISALADEKIDFEWQVLR